MLKILIYFRVPLLSNALRLRMRMMGIRFPLGFSSNMVFLIWCVFGGFLLHILECNYLTVLLKPNYERFVDTVSDIIEMNLTTLWPPGREGLVQSFRNSPSSLSQQLADSSYVSKVIYRMVIEWLLIKTRLFNS